MTQTGYRLEAVCAVLRWTFSSCSHTVEQDGTQIEQKGILKRYQQRVKEVNARFRGGSLVMSRSLKDRFPVSCVTRCRRLHLDEPSTVFPPTHIDTNLFIKEGEKKLPCFAESTTRQSKLCIKPSVQGIKRQRSFTLGRCIVRIVAVKWIFAFFLLLQANFGITSMLIHFSRLKKA